MRADLRWFFDWSQMMNIRLTQGTSDDPEQAFMYHNTRCTDKKTSDRSYIDEHCITSINKVDLHPGVVCPDGLESFVLLFCQGLVYGEFHSFAIILPFSN